MSCLGVCSLLFGRSITVNGRTYRVVRRIGEGGYSYVDLVNREGNNYAVKRMLLQVSDRRQLVEGEIGIHGRIQSSNVVRLVDSEIREHDSGNSTAYLVFPYYRNGTVQDMIEHAQRIRKPLPEKRILQLFLSASRGLKAMHTCSSGPIAHRDIKPGNLLLTDAMDELVLMDLGSAQEAECTIKNRQEALALQELCAQTCTAHYRAPELFEVSSDCTITAKTDLWSFGCTLYATAFGQSPCDGSALSAMSGRIVFPRENCYSSDFCDLVLWVLKVDPDSRPTAAEVEQRIEQLLQPHQAGD